MEKKKCSWKWADKEWGIWLFSALTVFILMFFMYLIIPIGFETNDDSGMMYILAGYRTGTPEIGTVYCNILWDCLISSFYRICAEVNWYIIIFVFLLFISNMMILKSILKICRKKPILFGVVF